MKQPNKLSLCIAWYKPEQWPRLLEISMDGDELEATFDEWRANTERALKDFAAQGVSPKKVVIDVNDLLAWCRRRNLPVSGESRSQYAAWLLQEKEKGKGRAWL